MLIAWCLRAWEECFGIWWHFGQWNKIHNVNMFNITQTSTQTYSAPDGTNRLITEIWDGLGMWWVLLCSKYSLLIDLCFRFSWFSLVASLHTQGSLTLQGLTPITSLIQSSSILNTLRSVKTAGQIRFYNAQTVQYNPHLPLPLPN